MEESSALFGGNGYQQDNDARFQSVMRRAPTPDSMSTTSNSHVRATTPTRALASIDAHTPASPRSIPGGEKSRDRRAGLVFHDTFNPSPAPDPALPILTSESQQDDVYQSAFASRQRTRTLDDHRRPRQPSTTISKSKHRIGSVHTVDELAAGDARKVTRAYSPELPSNTPFDTRPALSSRKSSNKDRAIRGLHKGYPDRSSSPLAPSPAPSFDRAATPSSFCDPNKILNIMRTLKGRMRGAIDFQTTSDGRWMSGLCYIDDTRGSLIFEGDDARPVDTVIIWDLAGCRVKPTNLLERQTRCLEITIRETVVRIIPLLATEFDHWLAAMLHWQQTRASNGLVSLVPTTPEVPQSATMSRSTSSKSIAKSINKEAAIIKVGKLAFWDAGLIPILPSSTSSTSRREPTANPNGGTWQKVSCILQDNGVFKLLHEDDIVVVMTIQLSQLSRCAVQRLDRSVLGRPYCIGIFPHYASTSTTMSIFRPVYVAFDQRVLFEVWFVLLRAFAVPEVYASPAKSRMDDFARLGYDANNDDNDDVDSHRDLFRIDKSLSIRVIEAKLRKPAGVPQRQDSRRSDKSNVDPNVGDYLTEVYLNGELRAKTACKENTQSPFWREECEFQDVPATTPDLTFVLKRRTNNTRDHRPSLDDTDRNVDSLSISGIVCIRLDMLDEEGEEEKWWPILNNRREQIGEMFLRIKYQEMVILPARDYQKLSELLHKFNNSLTLQLAQYAAMNLKQLSEILMNIFQVSGQSHEWLTTLVEDEIDGVGKDAPPSIRYRFSKRLNSTNEEPHGAAVVNRELAVRDMSKSLAGEANLLFRGNSLLTQALDFHMRRLGKDYLEEVLADRIAEIDALDVDCEVDPARIGPGEDITKHWAQLISLTTKVWEAISISAQRCPPGLRQILKYVRAVADDRYGEFLRTVPYTSVSGFLFLRFFCPALLNPKIFDLLRDHPKPRSQRTLTLIAKSLQVLANLSTFGQKEAWMEPMNKFLFSHRQDIKVYIDTITSIPGASQSFSLPASYSTPITILGRLPPTSREGFPSLPYLIDHARNFAALIKLWLETTSQDLAHFAPEKTEGDLQEFHELCLALRQKSSDCLRGAERGYEGGDVEAGAMRNDLQWDDLVTSLDQFNNRPLDITSALQTSIYQSGSTFPTPNTTGFSAISSTPFLPMTAFEGSDMPLPSLNYHTPGVETSRTARPSESSSSAETTSMGAISTTPMVIRGDFDRSYRTISESRRSEDVDQSSISQSSTKERKEKKERHTFWEIRNAIHHYKGAASVSSPAPSSDKSAVMSKSLGNSGFTIGTEGPRSSSPLGWGARQLDRLENVKVRDRDALRSGRKSEDTFDQRDENQKAHSSSGSGFLGLGALRKRIDGDKDKDGIRDRAGRKMSASSVKARPSEDASGGEGGNWL